MEETTVNRLNGIPFWGHGTMENLENGITPTNETETQDQVGQEGEDGNSDVGIQEQESPLGEQVGTEGEITQAGDSDSPEPERTEQE